MIHPIEYEIRKEISKCTKNISTVKTKIKNGETVDINDLVAPERLSCYRQGLLFALMVFEKYSGTLDEEYQD